MEIIQPQPSDLIEIIYLQRVYFSEMKMRGWLTRNFFSEFSMNDLPDTHILKMNYRTIGMLILHDRHRNNSPQVNWDTASRKPLVIHSLVVHPNWWEKEISGRLLLYAEEYAVRNGFTSIRLDAFSQDQVSIAVYQQLSFLKKGEFFSPFQTVPFHSYEKIL